MGKEEEDEEEKGFVGDKDEEKDFGRGRYRRAREGKKIKKLNCGVVMPTKVSYMYSFIIQHQTSKEMMAQSARYL